jgi:hypothetical protein
MLLAPGPARRRTGISEAGFPCSTSRSHPAQGTPGAAPMFHLVAQFCPSASAAAGQMPPQG